MDCASRPAKHSSARGRNAAGGVLWSGVSSVGFYHARNTLKRFRGDLALGALGVAAAVVVIVFPEWARRHLKRPEEEAERAHPGPP